MTKTIQLPAGTTFRLDHSKETQSTITGDGSTMDSQQKRFL